MHAEIAILDPNGQRPVDVVALQLIVCAASASTVISDVEEPPWTSQPDTIHGVREKRVPDGKMLPHCHFAPDGTIGPMPKYPSGEETLLAHFASSRKLTRWFHSMFGRKFHIRAFLYHVKFRRFSG